MVVIDVMPVVVLLFVMVILVVLIRVMRVLVVVTIFGVGVSGRMPLVVLGILGVNSRAGVEFLNRVSVVPAGIRVVMHTGFCLLDGRLGVREGGHKPPGVLDRLNKRPGDGPCCRLDRRCGLAFRLGRRNNVLRYNALRCRSAEGFRLLHRSWWFLALISLLRDRVGLFGVLLQCAELFSGQRPGAIRVSGA